VVNTALTLSSTTFPLYCPPPLSRIYHLRERDLACFIYCILFGTLLSTWEAEAKDVFNEQMDEMSHQIPTTEHI
jgi:hypothetical protein